MRNPRAAAAMSAACGMQRVWRVRARSQADHLSQARVPLPLIAPAAAPYVEDADEKTTIDPVGVPAGFLLGQCVNDAVTRRFDTEPDETAIDPVAAPAALLPVRRRGDAAAETVIDPGEPDNQ